MLHFTFYRVVTPDDEEWREINEMKHSGKLPWTISKVFIYRSPRQYERLVLEMEHWRVLSVKLQGFNPMQISPHYREIVEHDTCCNPLEGRLHVFLKEHESLNDIGRKKIFIPPIYQQRLR
jgi:hypothetical protein